MCIKRIYEYRLLVAVDIKIVHVKTHVYVTRYKPYLKTKLPCLFQAKNRHLALSEITFYTFYKRTISDVRSLLNQVRACTVLSTKSRAIV